MRRRGEWGGGREEGRAKMKGEWRKGGDGEEDSQTLDLSLLFCYFLHARTHTNKPVLSNKSHPLSHLLSCSVLLDDFLQDHQEAELQFAPLPFNHPLFIMYSSGTTGPPKCMVHSQGVSPYNYCLVDMFGTPLHAPSSLLDNTSFN